MFGFFFADQPVRSFGDTSSVDKDLFSRFFSIMLDRGVYFAPSAFEAGFVSCAHAQGPIEYAIAQLEAGFDELA
jgi:glutamate-1-semialdehyde 2,1-aminomutase